MQVADRWHLLKNWREVLERLLTRQHSLLQTSLDAKGLNVLHRRKRKRSSTEQAAALSARQHRVELYEQVHALKGQNHSILQIAQELGISRGTVRKYLSGSRPASPSVRRRPTQLIDPYQPYLEKRWAEGCHKAAPLWRELKAQGFSGTYKVVQRWVSLHRDQPGRLLSQREKQRLAATVGPEEPLPAQPLKADQTQPELVGPGAEPLPSPRQLAWLFIKRASKLSRAEQGWLGFIEAEATLSEVAQLSQKFVRMVREHRAEGLENWLEQCRQSRFVELQTFGEGIEHDYGAVQAGLTLVWSQGPTEGAVNKLKMIKRTSYGRGNFEQLRARVLRAS